MDLYNDWHTASNSSAVKAAAFADCSASAKLQNLPTRQMFATVLQYGTNAGWHKQTIFFFIYASLSKVNSNSEPALLAYVSILLQPH